MPNTKMLKDNGQDMYPITHVSCVVGMENSGRMNATYAWDGTGTPDVTKIPAGVTVTYDGTTYTGTLAASASTTGMFYLVPSTTVQGEYDRYLTDVSGSTFAWKAAGTTAIPSPNVVATLASTSDSDALAASQGKILNDNLSQLEAEVNGKDSPTEITGITWVNGYYTGGSHTPTGGGWASGQVNISQYAGSTIRIKHNVSGSSARYTYVANSNDSNILSYSEGYFSTLGDDGMYYGDILLPSDAKYIYISFAAGSTTRIVQIQGQERGLIDADKPVYVDATNGSDSASGEIATPVKSIAKAIEKGACIVLRGGTYNESIDLSSYKRNKIKIIGMPGEGVFINLASKYLTQTSSDETLVSGYTKVYKVSCATNPFSGYTQAWMFQDNISDPLTGIAEEDRNPLQRGLSYRCGSVIIKQQASIDAIEQLPTNSYGFYWDNGYMYYSRYVAPSANNPIVIPVVGTSFIKLSKDRATKNQVSVEIHNVEVRYGNIHLSYCSGVKMVNVRVKYPFVSDGGGFYFYNATNVLLERCEVCGVFDGSTYGDGFNFHTSASTTNRESFLTAHLLDCWAHDNHDDGYSDHENSEVTIDGGLFEFNGKGGITPSYGANDVIRNAICRYNTNGSVSNGIYVCGTPTNTTRKPTCTKAINCVCYGNNWAFRAKDEDCVLIAINCLAYNSAYGSFKADSGHIYAIGCKVGTTYTTANNISKMAISDY